MNTVSRSRLLRVCMCVCNVGGDLNSCWWLDTEPLLCNLHKLNNGRVKIYNFLLFFFKWYMACRVSSPRKTLAQFLSRNFRVIIQNVLLSVCVSFHYYSQATKKKAKKNSMQILATKTKHVLSSPASSKVLR